MEAGTGGYAPHPDGIIKNGIAGRKGKPNVSFHIAAVPKTPECCRHNIKGSGTTLERKCGPGRKAMPRWIEYCNRHSLAVPEF